MVMEEAEINPDALLARELNSLSLQERNAVLECIHGVDDFIKETPEMMEEKLAEFQAEVDRLLGNGSSAGGGGGGGGGDNGGVTKTTLEAYRLAQSQSEDYVQGPKLRIMFLRAETFNAPLAAQRMMIYLEEKLSRFGPKALTRGLTLKDLSPQSREMIVDMGIHQLLPVRDSAGRAIYSIHQDNRPRHLLIEDPMGAVNCTFYILSVAAEDEETQKRGLISLQVISWIPTFQDLEVIRVSVKRADVSKWCPVRVKANHIWAKAFQDNPMVRVILSTWSKSNRMRMRLHPGSYTELRYHLMTYGFPSDCLPYSSDGEELRLNAHHRWVSRRKKKESALRNSNTEFHALDLPGCRDICLGRGSASHQHVGNVYMRTLMSTLLEEYRVATSRERQELNKRLVSMVREGGGRFLNKTTGGWFEEETDEVEIERRVGGSFRGMLSRIPENNNPKNDTTLSEDGIVAAKRPRLDGLPAVADDAATSCFGTGKAQLSPRLDQSMFHS